MSLEDDAELDLVRLLDTDGKTVLDSVSAGYEDSFSLETFADVIRLHFEATNQQAQEGDATAATPTVKKAIIARVQTWDRRQPDKAYYSYYNAYHLNKILFQTQVYCGKKLIHRLHVLNPLTNTDIVGAVQYFQVTTIPKSAQVKAAPKESAISDLVQKSAQIATATSPLTRDLTIERRTSFYLMKALPPSLLTSPSVPSPSSNNEPHSAIEMRQLISAPRTAANTAVEDLLLRSALLDGKGSVKVNETKRKASLPTPTRNIFPEWGRQNKMPAELSESTAGLVNTDEEDVKRTGSLTKRRATLAAPAADTNIQQVINQRRRMSEMIHPNPAKGQVTQFARAVPRDLVLELAPPTPPRRRRILSLRNAMPGGDQQNPLSQQDMEQWRLQAQAQKRDTDLNLLRNVPSLPEEEEEANTNKKSEPEPYIYDAVLIGTDNDYLETSKMRALFREHAVTPSDVQLFEMPEYPPPATPSDSIISPLTTGPAGFTTFGQAVVPLEQASCITKLCCTPTNAALDRMHPCIQLFHHCKCYFFAGAMAFFVFFAIFYLLQSTRGN